MTMTITNNSHLEELRSLLASVGNLEGGLAYFEGIAQRLAETRRQIKTLAVVDSKLTDDLQRTHTELRNAEQKLQRIREICDANPELMEHAADDLKTLSNSGLI